MIEFRQVLSARAVRAIVAIQPQELRISTVNKLRERYHFGKVPQTFEELFPSDPNTGIKFEQGILPREGGKPPIVVELVQLLPNVVFVQTRTSTDDSDEFLDDYISNANKVQPDAMRVFGSTFYVSEIEFSWTKSLDAYAPRFTAAAKQLDTLVASYGSEAPKYRVASIIVNGDPSKAPGGAMPVHFAVERRAGIPDSENIFYSYAPLKTRDHRALLESLDRE
jgi:hypothetical protein